MGPLAIGGIIAAGQAIASFLSQRAGAKQQQRHNMQLAKFQASANEKYLDQQLAYNTPKAQMGRFQEAGLNPNLIYGQGNPGNQAAPLTHPDVRPTDMASMFNVLPLANQSALTASQVQATNAKTRHTYAMTELNKLQQQVLAKNPLLDKDGFNAIISGLKSAAEIKAGQAGIGTATAEWFTGEKTWQDENGKQITGPAGIWKMQKELDLLEQRFNLGRQDQAIKAQILKSKEFQNAILEVQKKFMTESDITPQHVLQFIQLLLMKLL